MSDGCLTLTIGCASIELDLGCTVVSGVAGVSVAANALVTPQSNGGVSAYPPDVANAISSGTTRVTGATADYDSLRMFGEVPEIVASSGQFGRIENETDFFIDLYPLIGRALWDANVQLAADVPTTIGPRAGLDWFVDSSGDLHVRG